MLRNIIGVLFSLKRGLVCLPLLLAVSFGYAQDADSIAIAKSDSIFIKTYQEIEMFKEQSKLDPNKSALLSAIVPGLGQIYNKQYWKVPIVVSGFLVFGHFINYNNRIYHALRNAALLDDQGIEHAFVNRINGRDNLIRNRDVFRRNRDFLIILGTVFYLLQIVDAHVSAHLDEFEINDQLSLQVVPTVQQTYSLSNGVGVSGVSLVLKF